MIIKLICMLPRWVVVSSIVLPLSGLAGVGGPANTRITTTPRASAQEALFDGDAVPVVDLNGSTSGVHSEGTLEEIATSRLSDPDFSERQRATWELWRNRDQSREWVQRAARDGDPEIAARGQRILELWRRGVLPETPPEVSRHVQSMDVAGAVEHLLEAGQFAAAVVAVDESLATIEREVVQGRVSRALTARFPIYARAAFELGVVPELLQLVDTAADSKELAVCRVQLMLWLGLPIDPQQALPQAAESWDRSEREEAMALLLVILGDVQAAVDHVEQQAAGDAELRRAVKMLAGRWSEMAAESMELAEAAPAGSADQARHWSHALVAADRAGIESIRAAAIGALIDEHAAADDVSIALRWQSLAVHGEIDAACRLLSEEQPEAAAEVALSAVRTHLAFKLLGLDLERVELNLDGWLAEAIETQRVSEDEIPVAEVRRMLALMKCLVSIGRTDLAWRIAEGMSRGNVAVGRVQLRAYVLTSLPVAVRRNWVRRLAVFPEEATLSTAAENTLVRALPDTDAATFGLLMESIEKMMPRASLRERLDVVAGLLDGKLPPGFEPKTGFRFIYQQLPDGRQRGMEQIGGRVVFQPSSQPTMGLVSFFSRHGQVEYARRCLLQLHASGTLEATFELAERALDSGRAEEAKQLFEQIWTVVSAEGLRRGGRSGTSLAAKSLVGGWIAARRQGDPVAAERYERLIRLVLATPSSETSLELLQYLGERGEWELAEEGFRSLLPMTAMGTREGTAFYSAAYAYAILAADERPGEAARWFDLAFSGTLESTYFLPAAYVTLPLVIHRWALQAAVQRRDEPAVRDAFDAILRLDPLDIRFAEDQIPSVREAGMEELANQTLDRIVDAGLRYSRDFPFDATTANNLAWIAAINGRRLDDALQLSEQAVRLHPESAVYRDTLAEVLFRLGRYQEAVQIEQACLLDDPGQWHLHEQLERFSQPLQDR